MAFFKNMKLNFGSVGPLLPPLLFPQTLDQAHAWERKVNYKKSNCKTILNSTIEKKLQFMIRNGIFFTALPLY